MSAVWITRDGREIPVRQMTDDHLINTVRYLRRTRVPAAEQYLIDQAYSAMSLMTGDYAIDAVESGLEQILNSGPDEILAAAHPAYREMLSELKRRNITP
jgi:hypothetical protein